MALCWLIRIILSTVFILLIVSGNVFIIAITPCIIVIVSGTVLYNSDSFWHYVL